LAFGYVCHFSSMIASVKAIAILLKGTNLLAAP
jgi:hypothetical protein